ncbi:hypothetical protein [Peijinzhouia sedimentorum]
MKFISRIVLIVLFFGTILIVSCERNEYVDTAPAPEVPGNPSVK